MTVRALKRYKKILKDLQHKVEAYPHYADLRHQLALLLFVDGDREGAEREFLQALKLNPEYREAAILLGCLYVDQGRWGEAEALFRAVKRKKPNDPFLQQILEPIEIQTGRIRKGHRIDPSKEKVRYPKVHLHRLYGRFHYLVGILLARDGKLAQALRELEKAAQWEPGAFAFHYHLGLIFYSFGDYRRSMVEFKRALALDPGNGMSHAHLSYLYGLKGKTEEAIRHMERAVTLNPRYADLHYHLGLLYSGQERYREAISEFKKALRLNPNYLFARINLGVLYEEAGKWKEARREYERVLQITPDDGHVRRRLERISGRNR